MRRGIGIAALLAALSAVPSARAQEQPRMEPAPGSTDQAPRPADPLGNAIRGFFESLFGSSKKEEPAGKAPAEPQAAPPSPPAPQAAPAAPAAPAAAPAVVATPSAAPTQTLHAAIAKGDFAAAV